MIASALPVRVPLSAGSVPPLAWVLVVCLVTLGAETSRCRLCCNFHLASRCRRCSVCLLSCLACRLYLFLALLAFLFLCTSPGLPPWLCLLLELGGRPCSGQGPCRLCLSLLLWPLLYPRSLCLLWLLCGWLPLLVAAFLPGPFDFTVAYIGCNAILASRRSSSSGKLLRMHSSRVSFVSLQETQVALHYVRDCVWHPVVLLRCRELTCAGPELVVPF